MYKQQQRTQNNNNVTANANNNNNNATTIVNKGITTVIEQIHRKILTITTNWVINQ